MTIPEHWQELSFEKSFVKPTKAVKTKKKDFKSSGKFPIVSQEKSLINGYTDNESLLVNLTKPIVIFGDHTKVIKFIDFDFAVGADGVKVFEPIADIDSKFYFYFLSSIKLDSLGYARHYRLLKEVVVPVPPIEEQREVVRILDSAFERIDAALANVRQNIINADELFQSKLAQIFNNPEPSWVPKKISELAKTSAGGTPLKSKKEYYENGDIPWLLSGEVANDNITETKNHITNIGLKNSSAKIYPEGSVLIAMYGATAGKVGILNLEAASNQAVCAIFPSDKLLTRFTYYFFLNEESALVAKAAGNAQPNISQAKIRATKMLVPSIDQQEVIVDTLDKLSNSTKSLKSKYKLEEASLLQLKKSLLQNAFTGNLLTNML